MPEKMAAPLAPDQSLAEQELVSSLSWLVDLRWLGGLSVLLGTWVAGSLLGLPLPRAALYLLGLGILAYNGLFWWLLRRFEAQPPSSGGGYQWFARLQIGLDWAAMALLVHWTGGIESRVLYFFLFHIIIASLLLPHDRAFLYVALAPLLVGGVAWLEYNHVLPHVAVFQPSRFDDPLYLASRLFFFTAACYVIAYLSMTVSRRLRRREEELAGLYRSVRAATSTLDLPRVLDRLAGAAAQALGCRAAAIRLLDASGSRLELAGAWGLSPAYRQEPPLETARASAEREALSGKTVTLDSASDKRLPGWKRLAAEGVQAVLIAPLIGKQGPLGVLYAFGGPGHHFTERDAEFLSTIAAQGAVAIENAQAYRMLEELDRSKSQFVRIVTHELRSPVQVAASLLNLLSGGYVGPLSEKQADLVNRALRRIRFLQTLIDDLLDLAAGRADVLTTAERGLVSLTEVLQAVESRYQAPAEEKGLTLRFEYPKEPLHVWGERGELDRIFNNLVSNAIKYTLEGEVSLLAERQGEMARVIVRDTGIGIPEDALPHLFQEFFRARNAKMLTESGTGLGLAIVKDLVERYGGEIEVESAEGQGTTFTVSLPLAEEPPPPSLDS